MKCEKYSNLIEDFAENELDAAIADEVSLHIFACESCEAQFELLNREKEIYSQFLFEIEPPKNLSRQFQARFENEIGTKSVLPNPQISFAERLKSLFSLKNPLPVMAALGILLLFGFGLFWSKNLTNEQAKSNDSNIEKVNQTLPINPAKEEVKEIQPEKVQSEIAEVLTKPPQKAEKVLFEKIKFIEPKREKVLPVKILAKNVSIPKKSNAENIPALSEEEKSRLQELQAFEQQTAKQMEKIEMLLRSFRNSRFSEETEQYDVSFEKQQARKLLETNENLRAQAQFYGDFYTKEMLDKVEPYLLDIANLENNPSTEMVLDIKQRVRNQNLIAGLQVF